MTKPESLVVKVLVRTYILTIQTQVFLFKSNYGTAVPYGDFFMACLFVLIDSEVFHRRFIYTYTNTEFTLKLALILDFEKT